MIHSGYFRPATKVVLCIGITYGKILFRHGVSDENVDKIIPTREYNNRNLYHCLDNTFTSGFCIPDLNLPLITIVDRPRPHKIALYIPDIIPATIYVSSENYISTLPTPSYSPRILLLTSDNTHHRYAMNKDDPYHGRVKIGYCFRKRDEKYSKNEVLLLHMLL